MFEYGTKGKSIVSIINRSIPLYISAIAVAVGFKMGLFNIGVEGQYLVGSIIAAVCWFSVQHNYTLTYFIYYVLLLLQYHLQCGLR